MEIERESQVDLHERLNEMIVGDSLDFDSWASLILRIEKADGDNIDLISLAYDSFLSKFPLCHWYWRKYAYHKARLCSIAKAVEIFEQAVGAATFSLGLWHDYCAFSETYFKEPSDIRRIYERGISYVEKDYLCPALWDKYMQFEFSQQQWGILPQLYIRILRFPTRKLQFYYECLQKFVTNVEEEISFQNNFNTEVDPEYIPNDAVKISNEEISQVVKDFLYRSDGLCRSRALHRYKTIGDQLYQKALQLDEKIKTFEGKIRRRYFQVTPLDSEEVNNWHQYLDFIEKQEDFDWALKLYERCLISCANYPEFWMRYVAFMEYKRGRPLAIFALDRATQIFVKNVPEIHLFSARFREQIGDANGARDAYLLCNVGSDAFFTENVVRLANMEKRQGNLVVASGIYENAIKTAVDQQKVHVLPSLYMHYSRLKNMICCTFLFRAISYRLLRVGEISFECVCPTPLRSIITYSNYLDVFAIGAAPLFLEFQLNGLRYEHQMQVQVDASDLENITGTADAARDIIVDGIKQVPHCRLLFEELMKFAMTHEGARHISIIEPLVADAISPGSDTSGGFDTKDKVDISFLFLEFVDLCGTLTDIRRAWDRHIKLFPQFIRPYSCKDPAQRNNIMNEIKEQRKSNSCTLLEHPSGGQESVQDIQIVEQEQLPNLDHHIEPDRVSVDQSLPKDDENHSQDNSPQSSPRVGVISSTEDAAGVNVLNQGQVHEPGNDACGVMELNLDSVQQHREVVNGPAESTHDLVHQQRESAPKPSELTCDFGQQPVDKHQEPDNKLEQDPDMDSLANLSLDSKGKESQKLIHMALDENLATEVISTSKESTPTTAPAYSAESQNGSHENKPNGSSSGSREKNTPAEVYPNSPISPSTSENSDRVNQSVKYSRSGNSEFYEHSHDRLHQTQNSHSPQQRATVETGSQILASQGSLQQLSFSTKGSCKQGQNQSVAPQVNIVSGHALPEDNMSQQTFQSASPSQLSSPPVSHPPPNLPKHTMQSGQQVGQMAQSQAINQIFQYQHQQQHILQQQYQQQMLQTQQPYFHFQQYQLPHQYQQHHHPQQQQNQQYSPVLQQQQQFQSPSYQLQQQMSYSQQAQVQVQLQAPQMQQQQSHQLNELAYQMHQSGYQQHADQGYQILLQQYQLHQQGYQQMQQQGQWEKYQQMQQQLEKHQPGQQQQDPESS